MKYNSNTALRNAWKQSCRETTLLLSENGNRLLLTEAGILSLLPVLFYSGNFALTAWLLAMSPTGTATDALIVASSLLLHLAFTLLLSLPLWLGYAHLACRIRSGKEAALTDLFHAFASPENYRAYLAAAFRIFWRLLLTAAALAALSGGATVDGYEMPFRILLGIAAILAAILWMGALPRIFRFPAKTDPEIFVASPARNTSASFRDRLLFFLRFLPWLLLGVATIGTTLLLDTFPRMALMYGTYCDQLR